MMTRKLFTSAFAIGAMMLATPALADPITLDSGDIGSSFTIDFDGFVEATQDPVANLTSTLTLTLDSVSSNQYSFSYSLANTTDGGLSSRVSSFAFNTDPDISSASATGDYSFVVIDGSYPNGIGAVDVCFKAKNSGSCSNGDGVSEGATGSGTLALNFAGPVSGITLDDFFVRYQGIDGNGFNDGSASGQAISSSTTTTTTTSTSGGTPVPAPGMLGLFAAALFAIGLAGGRRRRRSDLVSGPAFA